jgi:4-hydroxybenzoate polyprenyltransferase
MRAKFYDYFFLLRPTLLLPVWIFLFLGYLRGGNYGFLKFVLSFPSSFWKVFFSYSLLMGGIYILNQIFDIESDRLNEKLFLLPKGIISIRRAWIALFITLLLSIILAIPIKGDYLIIWILSLILGVLYSAPPFKFKGKPFLDLLSNSIGYGFLNFLAGWISSFPMRKEALLFSIPYVLAVGAVFLNTTIPDIPGDVETGEKTTGVIMGSRKTALLAFILLFLAFFSSLILRDYMVLLASTISLPPFFLAFRFNTDFFVKVAYRIGGGIFALIVAIHCPLFLILSILTLTLLKLYYRGRFGLNYPSLTGR